MRGLSATHIRQFKAQISMLKDQVSKLKGLKIMPYVSNYKGLQNP